MTVSDQDRTILRAESVSAHEISRKQVQAEPSRSASELSVLKSRFVLEDKLGSGGMGVVYKARDLRKVEARDRKPYVAVKVLNDDFRTHPEAFIALQREASKSQTISHPNIVSIFDFDKDGEIPFIIMELLVGRELADLLRSYPHGLPDPMAWDVIAGICEGLSHAHKAGVVHADLKPGNIFVSPENHAKILDFGIARAVQINQQHGEETVFDPARLAALTPAYASREMLNGDNPEPRDDLYSLGVVIYLVLTGHHPFGRLSASEAYAEGLKPEKPKRLTHRQWRGLKHCLAFNRHERLSGVNELMRLMLKPAPWRTTGAMAAAAAIVVALATGLAIDGQELNDVKEEVRQTTLLDAQLTRLSTLVSNPAFDPNWERLVWAETETLIALDHEGAWVQKHLRDVRDLYDAEIKRSGNIRRSLALLERAGRYGGMKPTKAAIALQLVDTVRTQVSEPVADQASLDSLTSNLALLEQEFPETPDLAELKLEIADVIEAALDRATRKSERNLVKERSDTKAVVTDALVSDLDALFAESCLRLDMDAIQSRQEGSRNPAVVKAGERRLGAGFKKCIDRLGAIERDRAVALHADVLKRFGRLPGLPEVAVDPCGMRYLVGNGSSYGRAGYCADRLVDQEGPRLVVIPMGSDGSRFAITKQEITWGEFRIYCEARNAAGADEVEMGCSSASEKAFSANNKALPVSGLSYAQVSGYISWLSRETGYTYRLPTEEEWKTAADGPADPNRNCRVSINGIERGLRPVAADMGKASAFGLIHVLGNVQEWVLAEDGLKASGGTYSDPIQSCLADTTRPHGGEADPLTGFRLVREVT